jgi:cytochrome c oxidase subunit 2
LPGRDVAAGYPPVMPSYQGQITEEQMFELISYLKSLRAAQPEYR